MLHKEFFGLIFLGFVFWIISATSPTQRMANACRPVGWTGNVVTSVSALALPSQQATVQEWFDRLEYGCQYTTWRLFYQDDYNKWKAANAGKPVGTAPAAAPVAPASKAEVKPQDAASVAPAAADAKPQEPVAPATGTQTGPQAPVTSGK